MRIQCHENTGLIYISTETVDDQFKLGRLAEKLKASTVQRVADGRELQISATDLLEALLKL